MPGRIAYVFLGEGQHGVGMKSSRLPLHIFSYLVLLLLAAGALFAFSATDADRATGTVSSTSVSFSGETATGATVVVETAEGTAQATAPLGAVPTSGDTVVLERESSDSGWEIPSASRYLVLAFLPFTAGLPLLIGLALAGSAALFWLSRLSPPQRPGLESDDAPLEKSEPAEEPAETTPSETRTSE